MKHYWKPTPKKWRKLGDSLLAVATVIAIGGIWQYDSLKEIFTPMELKVMIVSSIIFGVVGKFLCNIILHNKALFQFNTKCFLLLS